MFIVVALNVSGRNERALETFGFGFMLSDVRRFRIKTLLRWRVFDTLDSSIASKMSLLEQEFYGELNYSPYDFLMKFLLDFLVRFEWRRGIGPLERFKTFSQIKFLNFHPQLHVTSPSAAQESESRLITHHRICINLIFSSVKFLNLIVKLFFEPALSTSCRRGLPDSCE